MVSQESAIVAKQPARKSVGTVKFYAGVILGALRASVFND